MNQFKDRLQIAISNYSVNAFAKKSGITEGTLRTYLSGASLPGLDKIIAISNAAEVNIEWLATGNGPKKERFNLELLGLIIAGLDHLETSLTEELNTTEKTIIILYIYNLYYDVDLSLDQTKFSLMDTLKGVYNLFASFDGKLDTKKSQEQAIKIFTTILSESFSKEGAKFAAEALIGAKLLKRPTRHK